MAEEGLDALVVRAPDNVLYLTNFWGMKGYDAAVFPREGAPTLITLRASEADADRAAWTEDVRLFDLYDANDPRPPAARTLDLAREASRGHGHVDVDVALGFSLVWSGPGIRTFTATADRPIQANEPTLFEIWVCADGYWCDHTKNVCPGELEPRYDELLDQLLGVYRRALEHLKPGAGLAELDRLVRAGIEEAGYPGQPSHPVAHGVGARAHEPPSAH